MIGMNSYIMNKRLDLAFGTLLFGAIFMFCNKLLQLPILDDF